MGWVRTALVCAALVVVVPFVASAPDAQAARGPHKAKPGVRVSCPLKAGRKPTRPTRPTRPTTRPRSAKKTRARPRRARRPISCLSNSGAGGIRADINGDNYGDLVIGIPKEDVAGREDAGAVQIVFGGPEGPVPTAGPLDQHGRPVPPRSVLITQDTPGVGDEVEAGDQFGAALAVSDFNGDSFSDIAIGVPFEDLGAATDAGAVNIIFNNTGSAATTEVLTPTDPYGRVPRLWTQDTDGVPDIVESGDLFGFALAWANFTPEYTFTSIDLVIGAPGEDRPTRTLAGEVQNPGAGAVHVLYAAHDAQARGLGISVAGTQFWTQDSPGISDRVERDDHFGMSLTASQLGSPAEIGDSIAIIGPNASLAIGAPDENAGAGAVHVLLSNGTNLNAIGTLFFQQGVSGVADKSEPGDRFGSVLTTGDFDANNRRDLAISAPLEDITVKSTSTADAGAVHVLYGQASGLTGTGSEFFRQGAGLAGQPEAKDRAGLSLGPAQFGRGSATDLAIGIPTEDVGSAADAGAVSVLYGASGTGLDPPNEQVITQSGGESEAFDYFGWSLSPWRFRGLDSVPVADLVVGAPGEDLGTAVDAGEVSVYHGAFNSPAGQTGLGATPVRKLNQDSIDMDDDAETGDEFASDMY